MAKDKKEKGFGKKWKSDQSRLGVFTPVEAGDYKVVIESATTGQTKAKDGKLLTIKYKLLSGEEKGRTISEYLTYEHPNPTTEEIAAQHLASLCDAIGLEIEELNDPKQLVNKKLVISVGITQGNNDYGPGNKITAYEELSTKEKSKSSKEDDDDDDDDDDKPKKDKKDKKKKDKKKKDKPF